MNTSLYYFISIFGNDSILDEIHLSPLPFFDSECEFFGSLFHRWATKKNIPLSGKIAMVNLTQDLCQIPSLSYSQSFSLEIDCRSAFVTVKPQKGSINQLYYLPFGRVLPNVLNK
jgi:hypothetical protein